MFTGTGGECLHLRTSSTGSLVSPCIDLEARVKKKGVRTVPCGAPVLKTTTWDSQPHILTYRGPLFISGLFSSLSEWMCSIKADPLLPSPETCRRLSLHAQISRYAARLTGSPPFEGNAVRPAMPPSWKFSLVSDKTPHAK
ncbi:unnamed protein product [Lota lota]